MITEINNLLLKKSVLVKLPQHNGISHAKITKNIKIFEFNQHNLHNCVRVQSDK
jgi:hypothetical protein